MQVQEEADGCLMYACMHPLWAAGGFIRDDVEDEAEEGPVMGGGFLLDDAPTAAAEPKGSIE